MLTLDSDRLHIEIAEPESLSGQTRFDHAAFIAEVILDGEHRFCGVEPIGPDGTSSGGQGLCSEFLLLTPNDPISGRIIKPGVGLLEIQTDTPFDPFYPYPCVPVPIQVTQGNGFVRFIAESTEWCGYEIQICRTVIATGNTIVVETEASNTGKQPLAFQEYCHNFFCVGNDKGSVCCLELSDAQNLDLCISENERARQMYRAENQRIWLTGQAKKPAHFSVGVDHISETDSFTWHLTVGGRCIEGRACFQPSKVVVWSKGDVLCPEIFCQSNLKPGESQIWKRIWSFE